MTHLKEVPFGFTPPISKWLRDGSGFMRKSDAFSSESPLFEFLDRAAVQEMIHRHIVGQADESFGLWLLFVLERWLVRFW